MRLGLVLVALALAGVVAACSGGDQEAEPTFSPAPRGTVLGIVWQEDDSTLLRRLSRASLAPSSQAVKLGHNGGAWSFSPDESLVALAGAAPLEIRIVDVRRMRLDQVLPLPRDFARSPEEPAVTSLAWPTERRILVLVEWGAWSHALVVIDPFERRVVSREAIEGTLVVQARTHEGLALLLAPVGHIGPARLLLVDSAGDQRSIALAHVPAGLETIDPHRSVQRLAIPALAVDPTGARALVVPAAGPVAEVDLASGRVRYHDVHEPVSLLGRLRNWLEPAAEAKTAEGSERQAVVGRRDRLRYPARTLTQRRERRARVLPRVDRERWNREALDGALRVDRLEPGGHVGKRDRALIAGTVQQERPPLGRCGPWARAGRARPSCVLASATNVPSIVSRGDDSTLEGIDNDEGMTPRTPLDEDENASFRWPGEGGDSRLLRRAGEVARERRDLVREHIQPTSTIRI